jgi:PPM family protein phosphatase
MVAPRVDAARLFVACEMSEPELLGLAGGVAAVFSASAPGKPGGNEDAAALIPCGPSAAVLVVADGMGGARSGAEAAASAVRALGAALAEGARQGALLRTAILNGIERANQRVLELGVGAAATLAVVGVEGGAVRPYHVGDATILGVGQRGRRKLQTVAHSPVGFAVEAGLLDEADALHHEDRHLVSNALGAADMRIEVGSARRLAPRDTLLVASDGLADNLHTLEIVESIRVGPLDAAARQLAAGALQRMLAPAPDEPSKPDDLTFVLFRPWARRGEPGAQG